MLSCSAALKNAKMFGNSIEIAAHRNDRFGNCLNCAKDARAAGTCSHWVGAGNKTTIRSTKLDSFATAGGEQEYGSTGHSPHISGTSS